MLKGPSRNNTGLFVALLAVALAMIAVSWVPGAGPGVDSSCFAETSGTSEKVPLVGANIENLHHVSDQAEDGGEQGTSLHVHGLHCQALLDSTFTSVDAGMPLLLTGFTGPRLWGRVISLPTEPPRSSS